MGELIKSAGPAIGFALALIVFGIMWLSSRSAGKPPVRTMLIVFGGLLGWTVGILISPERTQQGAFSAYGTAILTFVTGFLVAKIERIFELKSKDDAHFVDAEFLYRILLGGAAFVLGVLCTFIWRTYVSGVAGA
jgi:hypothetical protein